MSFSYLSFFDISDRDSQAYLLINLININFLNLSQTLNDNLYSSVLQAVKVNLKEWLKFVIIAKYNFNLLNRHCLELYIQVNELKSAIEQYQIYQETLTVFNKNLKQQHQSQKIIIAYLQTHNSSEQSCHFTIISDLNKFDEINWSYLQKFVYIMQNKLWDNADWYSAEDNLKETYMIWLNYIYSWTFRVCAK